MKTKMTHNFSTDAMLREDLVTLSFRDQFLDTEFSFAGGVEGEGEGGGGGGGGEGGRKR